MQSMHGTALSPLIEFISAVVRGSLIKYKSNVARECDTRPNHVITWAVCCILINFFFFFCNGSALRLWDGIRSLACLYVFPLLPLSLPLSRKCSLLPWLQAKTGASDQQVIRES